LLFYQKINAMKLKLSLTTKIFLGMILGIIVGIILPEQKQIVDGKEITTPQNIFTIGSFTLHTRDLQLLMDIFLRLIKMTIAPLVLSTLVVGIAKVGDKKALGRIGVRTIGYFLFATLLALSLGLVLVNIFRPGDLLSASLPPQGTETGINAQMNTLKSFVEHTFPKSVIDAMAHNEILAVLVFSVFFGIAAISLPEHQKNVIIKAMDALAHVMLKLINMVMGFAPYGVFGAMAVLVSKIGWQKLIEVYPYLIFTFYLGLAIFIFVILGAIAVVLRLPFVRILKEIRLPFFQAFSTASSESAFAQLIESLKRLGCPEKVINFVIPLGYSFNLDGSIMYMTFASVFIAQAYGIELSFAQQIQMMLILMLTSKGIAGVPRASLVIIAGTLSSFNIPQEGLALLLGIDHILDMGRSGTNIAGNAMATCIISKWELKNTSATTET